MNVKQPGARQLIQQAAGLQAQQPSGHLVHPQPTGGSARQLQLWPLHFFLLTVVLAGGVLAAGIAVILTFF